LLAKSITIIQGTDQLREFGYRAHFIKTVGTATGELEDLHHMVPLYLGGDHTIANLMNVQHDVHTKLHTLIDKLKLGDTYLTPANMQNLSVSFAQGAAVIDKTTGVIEFRTLAELPSLKAQP
jgi:hypothetical protein